MTKEDTCRVFVCPQCGGPHFGSYVRPLCDENSRTYTCQGNEWSGEVSCGWSGPPEECFRTMTRLERSQFETNSGCEEFFSRLNGRSYATTA